jgi:hypothetical protein
VYGGAEVAIAGGFRPFYIDAKGRIWVGLEAGVKIDGSKYEIISAHAELAAHFRAPNPTFVMLHGEARYSFLAGLVSGSWEMDFSMPDKAPGASMNSDITTMPILSSVTPQPNATEVSRVNAFEIQTTMPIMEPFYYDDGNWYVLCVKDLRDNGDGLIDFTQTANGNHGMFLNNEDGALLGGLNGKTTLRYSSIIPLRPGKAYALHSVLQLRHFTPSDTVGWGGLAGIVGTPVHSVDVYSHFTSTADELNMREIVESVYPDAQTTPVYSDVAISVDMKNALAANVLRLGQVSGQYSLQVVNPKGESVPGSWTFSDVVNNEQGGSQRYSFHFHTDTPIAPLRTVSRLGEKRYAQQASDGSWVNPFENQTTAAASAGTHTTSIPYVPPSASSNFASASEQWGWDNKYTVNIIDNRSNEKIYGSSFFTAIPAEDGEIVEGTTAVIRDTLQNPYFFINYTINQSQFQQAANHSYATIVGDGRCQLLTQFKNGYFAISPDPEHLCSIHGEMFHPDYRNNMPCYSPSNPPTGSAAYGGNAMVANENVDEVLNACSTSKAAREALEEQYNNNKEALAIANSTVNFNSLELRFTTAAPINWHDIELEVQLMPRYNGALRIGNKPISFLSFMLHKGDYIVKSQPGSLEQRVELKLNALDDFYSSGRFLKYIDLYKEHNIPMLTAGRLRIYKRKFNNSSHGDGLNYSATDQIYKTNQLELKSLRPPGSPYANATNSSL